MTKRISLLLLCVILLASLLLPAHAQAPEDIVQIAAEVLGSEASFKRQSIKSKYKRYAELGVDNEILSIWKNSDGYVFWTKVFYGADFYESPSLEAYVGLRNDGTLSQVRVAAFQEHTQQFVDLLTPDYLADSYAGKAASLSFEADAATGATFTSQAVLYSVQLAANYAANVFNIGDKNAPDVQLKKLMAELPGIYEKVDVDPAFASPAGRVEYAARGRAEDGKAFAALVVSSLFEPEDANNNMTLPTYQIWIDTSTNQVFHARMLTGRFYEGFDMPPGRLEAYYGVDVSNENAYDGFTPGLITDAPDYVVTSATASFPDTETGSTPNGNDTSRAVRNCFIAAAQYYASHFK